MNKNYSYPLDLSWSTEELASVLSFFNQVEQAYEQKADARIYLEAYKAFKKVVPSIGEEKRLGKMCIRDRLIIMVSAVNSSFSLPA